MKTAPLVWGLAGILLCGGVAGAQSLAELARKEEARRKAVASPGKVYTNDDLRRYPVLPPPPQPAPPPDAAGSADPVTGAKPQAAPPPAEPKDEKGEAYWKKLMTDARSQLARSTAHHEAMQSRINALTADFYARDDPAQRAAIWADRTKALEELDRLAKDIDDQKQAIAQIEEDARKAGVPPGWLR